MSSPSMEMMRAVYPDVPWRSALQLHDLCLQGAKWVTKNRQVLDIPDLDVNHARNILKYLDDRAQIIKLAAEAWWMDTVERHDGGEMAHDSLEESLNEVLDMDARAYLHDTNLYKALEDHIKKNGIYSEDYSADIRDRDCPSWDQPYT